MKTKVLWALVALNGLLIFALVSPLGHSTAQAQQAKQARAGDHFLMVSGEVTGGPSAVVYIVDETANGLTARSYDDSRKQFNDMAPIDLDRVFPAQ